MNGMSHNGRRCSALVEAFAESQRLQAVRQRNTLQALAEAFAKGIATPCKPWVKHSPKVKGRRLFGISMPCKLWLKHSPTIMAANCSRLRHACNPLGLKPATALGRHKLELVFRFGPFTGHLDLCYT